MRVPKKRPIQGSSILLAQSEQIAKSPSLISETDDSTEASRRALAALDAEDVTPMAVLKKIVPGTPADPSILNQFFVSTESDLNAVYTAGLNMQQGLVNTYNVVASKEADIIGSLKTLRNKISTLKLYSTDLSSTNQYLFLSFGDATQLSVPDSGTPLAYSEEEGALYLPFAAPLTQVPIKAIKILDGSNGSPGNSKETTRPRNNNPRAISDGDLHTWFEYERIQNTKNGALTLNLELQLASPSVINHIRIDPINFGTAHWLTISDIKLQTTLGPISIRPDLQTSEWTPDTDVLALSPATSRFAGQGVYTFSPAEVTSVTISLIQNEPYPINDGALLRYAIGLREIILGRYTFESAGAFKTSALTFQQPVRTLALKNSIAPYGQSFVAASYEVSVDGGQKWMPIVPQENQDDSLQEVISFDAPVSDIILRGTVTKDSSKFELLRSPSAGSVVESIIPIPRLSSKLPLEQTPDTFVEVLQLGLGSCGTSGHPLFLGSIRGGAEASVLYMPAELPREKIRVLVDGEYYPVLESFTTVNDIGVLYDETASPPQLIFGDGIEDGLKGRKPHAGAEVYLYITPDTTASISGAGPFIIDLSFDSDTIPETTSIAFKGPETKAGIITSGPGQRFVQFPEGQFVTHIALATNGDEYSPLVGSEDRYTDQDGSDYGFRNGSLEFKGLNGRHYSMDWAANKLYFDPPNSSSQEMSITYAYRDNVVLSPNEWSYVNGRNQIKVTSTQLKPKICSVDILHSDARQINLIQGLSQVGQYDAAVISGSIVGTTADMRRALETEVPFINGAREFQSLYSTQGFYSVDYKRGFLHIPLGESLPAGQIRFSYLTPEISYGLAKRLRPEIDYKLQDNAIIFLPSFINSFAEQSRNRPERNTALIRYDYKPSVVASDKSLAPYYSPVIRDITLIGTSIDPRLGTLEAL